MGGQDSGRYLYLLSVFMSSVTLLGFYYDMAALWYGKKRSAAAVPVCCGTGAMIVLGGILMRRGGEYPAALLIVPAALFWLGKRGLRLKMSQAAMFAGFCLCCILTAASAVLYGEIRFFGYDYSAIDYYYGQYAAVTVLLYGLSAVLWVSMAAAHGVHVFLERIRKQTCGNKKRGTAGILAATGALLVLCLVFLAAGWWIAAGFQLNAWMIVLFAGGSFVFWLLLRYDFDEGRFLSRELDLRVQQARNEALEQSLRELELGMEQWRQSVHDYKNSLLYLTKLAEERDMTGIRRYLAEENKLTEKNIRYYRTGNALLDVVVNTKYRVANQQGIAFVVSVDLPEQTAERLKDRERYLAVILGNLYDNAIEAAADCLEGYVSLAIWTEHQIMELEMLNSYVGKRNKDFATTKTGNGMHGVGLKSVKNLVERSGGRFFIELKQGRGGKTAAEIPGAEGEARVLVELPV